MLKRLWMEHRSLALPFWGVLKGYQLPWLSRDLVAGFTACVVMIPSVLAYAELVHMPPITGIYAALAAAIGYALFASSRQVIVGPDAAIGLLAGTAILPLAAGDPSRIPALAASLALLAGVVLILAAHLRIGTIADFLSRPVLVGYLNGASLILASTQLGKMFGIKTTGEDFFPLLWQILTQLPKTHAPTFIFGMALMMAMILLARVAPRLPGALAVTVLGILATHFLGMGEMGVALVGEVSAGTPSLVLPVFYWSDVPALTPAAVAIAFLAFSDGILLAQVFADKNRYEIHPNRELSALGMANLAAGLWQGFPVSASQSRTSIVDAAGGRTQVAQLVAAGGLLLFLYVATDLLALLPKVALGAILIVTALGMLEIAAVRELYRIDRFECFMSLLVTAAILVAGVVPGIIVGLLISLVGVIVEISRPGDAVLKRIGKGRRFHDFGGRTTRATTIPGLLIYRLYAPLIFANARHVMNRLRTLAQTADPPLKWIIIDAQAITDMDVTAAQRFAELIRELREARIEIKIADPPHPLMEQLRLIGLSETLGNQQFFVSVKKAVEAYESLQRPVQKLQFTVQEADQEPCLVTFRREGSNMTATCTCSEEDDALCDHRLALLLGDLEAVNILDGDDDDLAQLRLMKAGTDIDEALQELGVAEEMIQRVQRDYHQAREQLRKAMND